MAIKFVDIEPGDGGNSKAPAPRPSVPVEPPRPATAAGHQVETDLLGEALPKPEPKVPRTRGRKTRT